MRMLPAVPTVLAALASLVLLGGCAGGPGADPEDARPEVAASGDVRLGDGAYAVVLAHGAAFDAASWYPQAEAIADQGATVVAVEDTSPEAIAAAVAGLEEEGHPDVALVGASAGADAVLALAAEQPDLPDQLVLLSPNGLVEGLGEEPKLFVASADEPVADVSRELAETAPGDDNQVLILPGSAHAQDIFDSDQGDRALAAVLERLDRG